MIHGYSTGADCGSTLSCLRALGVPIEQITRDRTTGLDLEILGVQIRGFQPPASMLDAGNSGSTIRMLSGILAAHPFKTTITGDSSLKRRPMMSADSYNPVASRYRPATQSVNARLQMGLSGAAKNACQSASTPSARKTPDDLSRASDCSHKSRIGPSIQRRIGSVKPRFC